MTPTRPLQPVVSVPPPQFKMPASLRASVLSPGRGGGWRFLGRVGKADRCAPTSSFMNT